jgi:hypothetical protein
MNLPGVMTPPALTKGTDEMKTTQSVLPGAIRKACREAQIAAKLKSSLAETFKNGFWYCQACESRCERVEGENGQPSHCDRCGDHHIKWNPPLWSALIDNTVGDTQLIHPGEL